MSLDTFAMKAFFAKLGLEPEAADVYLALYAYGPQNMLQLSRNSGVERTRLYKIVDILSSVSLLEIDKEYKRNTIKAAPISNLQILLAKKDQEIRSLHAELETINTKLPHKITDSQVAHVQFYRGEDGVRQMFWNETKAKTENLAILYENMQSKTNAVFFQRWVEKCNERDIKFRGIIGDHFIETQVQWYAKHVNERIRNWQARYIPATLLDITHSTIVYDDVVAYYNWKDGEIFGIELYSPEIAQTQRHLFEMLWMQSFPVDDLKPIEKVEKV